MITWHTVKVSKDGNVILLGYFSVDSSTHILQNFFYVTNGHYVNALISELDPSDYSAIDYGADNIYNNGIFTYNGILLHPVVPYILNILPTASRIVLWLQSAQPKISYKPTNDPDLDDWIDISCIWEFSDIEGLPSLVNEKYITKISGNFQKSFLNQSSGRVDDLQVLRINGFPYVPLTQYFIIDSDLNLTIPHDLTVTTLNTYNVNNFFSNVKLDIHNNLLIPNDIIGQNDIFCANNLQTAKINNVDINDILGGGIRKVDWTLISIPYGGGTTPQTYLSMLTIDNTTGDPASSGGDFEANSEYKHWFSVVGNIMYIKFFYQNGVAASGGSTNSTYHYKIPSPYNVDISTLKACSYGLNPYDGSFMYDNPWGSVVGNGTLFQRTGAKRNVSVILAANNVDGYSLILNSIDDTKSQGPDYFSYDYSELMIYSFEACIPIMP